MTTTRRPIIAGNWKMNTLLEDAKALAIGVRDATAKFVDSVDVVVIPPSCFLVPVLSALGADSAVGVGAQNVHPEARGAFTGELSAPMVGNLGCRYVVCGHSERRALFGEPSEFVGLKVASVHAAGMTPILCVGETLEQREAKETMAVVTHQLVKGISTLNADAAAAIVVAYEPVWAIGTGLTATPAQAQEIHAGLRAVLANELGEARAQQIRIQYGGSVKPHNAA
ncbi:MAG: triosephosphate isomerase, partial [Myxococcota bacterium]